MSYQKISVRKIIIPGPHSLEWRVEQTRGGVLKRGKRLVKVWLDRLIKHNHLLKSCDRGHNPPNVQQENTRTVTLPVIDQIVDPHIRVDFDSILEQDDSSNDDTATLSNDVPQIIDYYLNTDREELQSLKQQRHKVIIRKRLVELQIADLNAILAQKRDWYTQYHLTQRKVLQLMANLTTTNRELEARTQRLNELRLRISETHP